MSRVITKTGSVFVRLSAGIVSAAFALGMAQAPAAAKVIVPSATKEVALASPDQASAYCESGKMPAGDIAYINGAAGTVQYGPDQNCVQQVPTKISIKKAIQVVGTKVSECKLQSPKRSILFCQQGGIGEFDIDYVSGKVGKTISGPGYGCTIGFSTSGIGNAICK